MDAVDFIKTRDRMCMHYHGCNGCPIDQQNTLCEDYTVEHPEEVVEKVEEWIKTHPIKTNADKIEELTGTKIEIGTHNTAYLIRVTTNGNTESVIAKLKRWLESEYVEK